VRDHMCSTPPSLGGGAPPSGIGSRAHVAGGGRISMPYRGAAAMARRSRSSRSASLSAGPGEVRVGTGRRTRRRTSPGPRERRCTAAVPEPAPGCGTRGGRWPGYWLCRLPPAGRAEGRAPALRASPQGRGSTPRSCAGAAADHRPAGSACRASRTARRSARRRAARCRCRPPPPDAAGQGPRGARSPARGCGRPPTGRSSDRHGFVVYTHL
jgi:hypothetical protein